MIERRAGERVIVDGLNAAQWTALALLFDRERKLGRELEAGDAGVYTTTWADSYTVGIHYRTADALAHRGLVRIEPASMPDEPDDLFLTDEGRARCRPL